MASGAPRCAAHPRFLTVAEAAQAQNQQAVLAMLSEGCHVDAPDLDGNTALHWATWFRLDSLRSELLQRGASPAARNNAGETALHWAAKAGDLQALKALSADSHDHLLQTDCDGYTPFLLLAQGDHGPVMECMYLRGVSIEEQDHLGRTALHWVCYRGHRRTAQWLMSRSANISHRDHDGMTPIHWAALKGHIAIVDMLMDVGAVHLLQATDSGGDTPIDLAMRRRNRYLVAMFYKSMLFQRLFGRPVVWRNNLALVFVGCVCINVLVFAFILAPGVVASSPRVVVSWVVLMLVMLALWQFAVSSDPGWLRPATVLPQDRTSRKRHAGDADDSAAPTAEYTPFGAEHPAGFAAKPTDAASDDEERGGANFQQGVLCVPRRPLEDSPGFTEASVRSSPELLPLVDAGQAVTSEPTMSLRQEPPSSQCGAVAGEDLGKARTESLRRHGDGAEYIELLGKGSFKQVCVVCRAVREPRSHHCKECGRCVRRLDHHCPWIDNCVGLGNQRTFFCFLVVLLLTLLGFYWAAALYVVHDLVPAVGAALGAWARHPGLWLGSGLGPPLVLLTCAVNVVWLGFVGALVLRTSAYAAVNITTFEVLTQPPHVQRRFSKRTRQFWFLEGVSLKAALAHCGSYWTRDMAQDACDFPARDGAVLPAMGSPFAGVAQGSPARAIRQAVSREDPSDAVGRGRASRNARDASANAPSSPVAWAA